MCALLPETEPHSEARERPKLRFWHTQQVSLEPKLLIELSSHVCDLRLRLHTPPRTRCTHREVFFLQYPENVDFIRSGKIFQLGAHTGHTHTQTHATPTWNPAAGTSEARFGFRPDAGPWVAAEPGVFPRSLASLSRDRSGLKAASARDPGECRPDGDPQGEAGPLRRHPSPPSIWSSRRTAWRGAMSAHTVISS